MRTLLICLLPLVASLAIAQNNSQALNAFYQGFGTIDSTYYMPADSNTTISVYKPFYRQEFVLPIHHQHLRCTTTKHLELHASTEGNDMIPRFIDTLVTDRWAPPFEKTIIVPFITPQIDSIWDASEPVLLAIDSIIGKVQTCNMLVELKGSKAMKKTKKWFKALDKEIPGYNLYISKVNEPYNEHVLYSGTPLHHWPKISKRLAKSENEAWYKVVLISTTNPKIPKPIVTVLIEYIP